MKRFNIGIQLYGVRETLEQDFEGTLKALKDMGYDYVEFAGYCGKTSAEIKEILDRYDLRCVSVHQGLAFFEEDMDAGIEFLRGFGVKYCIIPWFRDLANTDKWEASVAAFKKVGAALKAKGMKLGYHNHDFEFEKHEGKYLHDYIFDDVGRDLIFPEIDTCWVHYAGIRPEDKLREFKGEMPVVHLKDFVCKNLADGPVYDLIGTDGKEIGSSRDADGFAFCPLGCGRQNFPSILAACRECGVETVIVEQDRVYDGMTEMEAARISREYLRTLGL